MTYLTLCHTSFYKKHYKEAYPVNRFFNRRVILLILKVLYFLYFLSDKRIMITFFMAQNMHSKLIMQDISYENSIVDNCNYLKKIFDGPKSLARLFRTNKNGYLYDTGTNKILACDDAEYILLEKLMSINVDQAIDSILSQFNKEQIKDISNKLINVIEKENILLTKRASEFGLSAHQRGVEELINNSLGILQLEITENCNLRCEYCVYNPSFHDKRNHGIRKMSLSVAQNAINYLLVHSKGKNKASITFYGGEPLLRYSFIKKCVNYSQRLFEQKDLHFSITTNGTLLTKEMAEFFFSNKFHLTFSIDGPEDIHDDYRKDAKGQGSFRRAIAGLKNAIDVFGKYSQERILLSLVYTPPWSEKKLNRIAELWNEMPRLLAGIHVMISYPRPGTIPSNRFSEKNLLEDKNLFTWASEIYEKDYADKKTPHPIVKSVLEKRLAKLYQRPIYSEPVNKYHLNGCCIPGVRKIFVSTNGDFHVCERISHGAPRIGDAFSGINIDAIKKIYIEDYSKRSIDRCSTCWAVQQCGICYDQSFNNGRYDDNIKKIYCNYERNTLEKTLIYYCSLLEKDQDGLEYLGQMVFE